MSNQFIFVLAISASNAKFPRVRRLSTISSVIAAAGHVFSTRWQWYWQDETGKWQSYDTPGDGHAVNTTSSRCFETDYVAGTTTVLVRKWWIRSVKAARKQKGLCGRNESWDYQLQERSIRHHLINRKQKQKGLWLLGKTQKNVVGKNQNGLCVK